MIPDRHNPNHIFVFGSNIQGIHGAGAAATAMKDYDAIYGDPMGLQGRAYAIVTKDLEKGRRSIPLNRIKLQLEKLAREAGSQYPSLTFFLTPIGTGLAGYTRTEIKELIDAIDWPENVKLYKWTNPKNMI